MPNEANWSLMMGAAESGNIEAMRWLKEQGASINDRGKWSGSTPIHYAALHGHLEAVQWLKSQGVDINVKNNENQTPLHYVRGSLAGRYAGRGNVNWLQETERWMIRNGARE